MNVGFNAEARNQDAPIALWTFIATSFGLMIASIANRDQLSFFQALQVSNLVW